MGVCAMQGVLSRAVHISSFWSTPGWKVDKEKTFAELVRRNLSLPCAFSTLCFLYLSLPSLAPSLYLVLSPALSDSLLMMRSKELKSSRFVLMLTLSMILSPAHLLIVRMQQQQLALATTLSALSTQDLKIYSHAHSLILSVYL